jgi:hypothetical protein
MAKYVFRLKKFTPDTLPLDRLGAYLSALAVLVGKDSGVTFDKVTKGSAVLNLRVPDEAVAKVETRVKNVVDDPEGDAGKSVERLNALLREDGDSASFSAAKGAPLLKFAGVCANADYFAFPVVKEPGEFSGRIIRIGGKDNTIPISLLASDGKTVFCTADPDMARRLKVYLLEDIDVTLYGQGKWERIGGKWELLEFKISDAQVLDFSGADETLARAIGSGSGWDTFTHPIEAFLALRHGA